MTVGKVGEAGGAAAEGEVRVIESGIFHLSVAKLCK
jgi:hypothetical protein